MDYLFEELIGKPKLNPPKIITVVADNFSLLEYQARFLKATIAIPNVKQLPLDDNLRLVQIGNLHQDIHDHVDKYDWILHQYHYDENVCDKMAEELLTLKERSIIFINDVSRLEMASVDPYEPKKLLALADKLKRVGGHFVVLLYQNSNPKSSSRFLSNIEYMSDAVVHAKHCKVGYFLSIWFETVPDTKTLIPPKVVQSYYTCKIGTNYWSKDLLCFYDKKKVPKSYNPQTDTFIIQDDTRDEETQHSPATSSSDEVGAYDSRTLPHTRAANPENSRIFFYPDKDDDLDEDDPDNDLGI